VSGKKSKGKRKTQAEDTRLALAESLRHEPEFINTVNDGDDEVWQRGKMLLLIPAIRDKYPAGLKNAIGRRRRAVLTGQCECGARQQVSKKGTSLVPGRTGVVMDHSYGCIATTESIGELLRDFLESSTAGWWAVIVSDYAGDPEPDIMAYADREIAAGAFTGDEAARFKVVTEMFSVSHSPLLMNFIKNHVTVESGERMGGMMIDHSTGMTARIASQLRGGNAGTA
jgi:hypothetical protein